MQRTNTEHVEPFDLPLKMRKRIDQYGARVLRLGDPAELEDR